MSYSHIDFAGEREKSHDSIELLMEEINSWDLTQANVNSNDLKILDDGKIQNGEARTITKSGLTNLCKTLRIPDPFACRIPWNLLQHNINELLKCSNKMLTLHYDGNNGELLNIAKPRPEVELDELLDRLQSNDTTGAFLDIKSGVQGIQLINEGTNFDILEPKVGDVTKGGIGLLHSPTGFMGTKAAITLFRLVCSNGVIVPARISEIKMKVRETTSGESAIRTFIGKFNKLVQTFDERIKPMYQIATEKHIREDLALKIYKGVTKITGDSELGIQSIDCTMDEIKELNSKVKNIRKTNRSMLVESTEEIEEYPLTYYEAHNNVSQLAHGHDYKERIKMQKFAGEILTSVVSA